MTKPCDKADDLINMYNEITNDKVKAGKCASHHALDLLRINAKKDISVFAFYHDVLKEIINRF